jgi:hypothetical protein
MTKFPLKVHYLDKDETQIVQKPEDIQKGRAFEVEELNVHWGRKMVVQSVIPIEGD